MIKCICTQAYNHCKLLSIGEDDKTKQARQKAALEAAFKKGQQQGKKDKKNRKDNDSASDSDDGEGNVVAFT